MVEEIEASINFCKVAWTLILSLYGICSDVTTYSGKVSSENPSSISFFIIGVYTL